MSVSKVRLKWVFSEIVRGYSKIESKLLGTVYIKHLDNFTSSDMDLMSEQISASASSQGLPNNKEKLEFLKREGLWTDEDEIKIKDTKSFIEGLRLSRSKQFLKAQIEQFSAMIKEEETKLAILEYKRADLIGYTVEKYADRRTNQYYMFCSVYKDKEFTERLFSQDEFEELDDDKMEELARIYTTCAQWFNTLNLKKIAVSPYFMNYFYLCEDNPQVFYGKPVCDLTFNQVELFGYGRYFKAILSETQSSVPPDVADDPEKLVEWYESRKNAAEALKHVEEKDGMNVSLVGATKEDLDNLGISHTGRRLNLAAEAEKKGGRLSMEDLIRLQQG